MIKNTVNSVLQNKNAAMFITAMFFMSGILSYFYGNEILFAGIMTIAGLILVFKNFISPKYVFLWIFVFYLGFFNANFRVHSTDDIVPYAGEKVMALGQIVSIPNSNTPEKSKFFFKINAINNKSVSGKTFVTITSDDKEFSDFKIGNFYQIKGSLKTPFKAGNPSQFDYGKYLRNFDAFTVLYAEKSDCIVVDNNLTRKWKSIQKLNNLRNKIINAHSKYLQSPNLEILGGIVFGDDAVAPPDYIKTSFVNSGLLHILAASGMNVAFIYGFWVFFMRRLKVSFKITTVTGMLLVIIYTFMTGLGASVIRAALMLLFILLGKLIDRDAHSISLLAVVGMLMLIYNPAFINDVGFQLSFVVTFGLLTTANFIFEKLPENKILNYTLSTLFIPVIAQVWVIPIQMFYFNTISTYSIPANILSLPFLSVVSFGGFLSSIIAIFSPYTDSICRIIDFILNYALDTIVFISNYFAKLPNSLITTQHPYLFQIFIYYTIVMLITLLIKTKINRKAVTTICILIIIVCLSTIKIPSKDLEIIAFDVQNADCFLIKTPKNKYFIIDTGRAGYKGSKAQANSIIIKYLKDNGIKDIEGLIITHFDNDHSGGALDIMDNFNIQKVYINSFNNKSSTSYEIYKYLKDKNIKTEIPKSEIYNENNLTFTTYIADKKEDNDKSIITLLTYKTFNMLFTGDAGIGAFEEVKNQIPNNIEVLKVGHHGGPNVVSYDMLNKFKPNVSIISTGPNSFGHPNRGTLDILRNTEIYRTDRHNSIKINSDGIKYKIFTYDIDKQRYVLSKEFIAKN